jgi:hypothetical protein
VLTKCDAEAWIDAERDFVRPASLGLIVQASIFSLAPG